MKIFIISPNADKMLTKEHHKVLNAAGEVTIFSEIKPFDKLTELYDGDEPRIVAIDPDFSDWKFPNEVIDKIPNLKAICLQTTSFSWVDVKHAAEQDIPVVDLRGFSSIAVAEWATFMALAVARRVPQVIKDGWKLNYEKHRGFELRGKTAGIIGLGSIGTATAENLAGLGMNVKYWSRKSEDARFKKSTLEDVIKTSDAIFVTIAINSDTRGMINDGMLRSIQPTSIFVNITDTNEIYNHQLLLELVADSKVGGYAFEDEKNPFGKYSGNIWNGPALAWCTKESMEKNTNQWVESIVNAAKGRYPTKVN